MVSSGCDSADVRLGVCCVLVGVLELCVCCVVVSFFFFFILFFFLMIRRPPRSTLDRSSAASDVYKRQDFDKAKYEVPKGDGTSVGVHAIFAGAIWISGLDAAGNLKLAGMRFRQGTSDFYSGPLLSLIHISEPTRPY